MTNFTFLELDIYLSAQGCSPFNPAASTIQLELCETAGHRLFRDRFKKQKKIRKMHKKQRVAAAPQFFSFMFKGF